MPSGLARLRLNFGGRLSQAAGRAEQLSNCALELEAHMCPECVVFWLCDLGQGKHCL